MSRNENAIQRREVVRRFALAGARFEPPVVRAFAVAFHCPPSSVYEDLRKLEPETGRLLVNPTNLPKAREPASTG